MPSLPKRPCKRPGCAALVTSGYCAAHAASGREDRPSAAARGYDRRWQRYRLMFLRRNPLCAGCQRVSAEHVDHIQPVKGPADPLFWEPTNHQGLCASCHSQKTAREDGGFGRGRRGRAA